MSEPLEPLSMPLWGSRLIEASAGTGKTWTIAALYLRLVLGHGDADTGFGQALPPSSILVMTFTRAATRELSDRIRRRLFQAAAWFRHELPVDEADDFLQRLRADYAEGAPRQQAAWLLAQAAESMDDAAVHTIDAWCQKLLREHAFDSGAPFDETLLPDEVHLRRQAVHDYWRQSVYPLTAEQADPVLRTWASLEALEQDVKDLGAAWVQGGFHHDLLPDPGQALGDLLATQLAHIRTTLARIKPGWTERLTALREWCDGQFGSGLSFSGNHFKAPSRAKAFDHALQWAAEPNSCADEGIRTLVTKLDDAALSGVLNKGKAMPELPTDLEGLRTVLQALGELPDVTTSLRWHAALWVRRRMALIQRQQGTFTFDDLLGRMMAALEGPHGERLRQRIVQQYPIALIDEFQDTSPRQYRVFDAAYRVADNARGQGLFLIGDPKQSIYGFRGADIHSYLRARDATLGRHHVLGTNHRSTDALVRAVNHVFLQADEAQPRGAFAFRTPHRPQGLPFVAVQAKGRPDRLITSEGTVPSLVLGLQGDILKADAGRTQLADHAAQAISTWLNDPHTGTLDEQGRFKRLRPADVAVLVRSGTEARVIRQALRRRSVASVYLSDRDSVFHTDEATELLGWMHAVGNPRDLRLARSAFSGRMVGLSLHELLTQSQDDALWDERLALLWSLHQVWQRQGIVAMVRRTVQTLGLAQRWLAQPQGERSLTNMLHLAELLQTASAQLDGEQALVRWFTEQIQSDDAGSDERIVRLESDADLVQVVTVHKSKGLEYPVVVMPFAASRPPVRKPAVVSLADEEGARHVHTRLDDAHLEQAEAERLCEDLRLMYVALTRARHALWLGVSAQAAGHNRLPSSRWALSGTALGWLLRADAATRVEQLPELLERLQADGIDLHVRILPSEAGLTVFCPPADDMPLLTPPPYEASFERHWTVGSYTSLTRDMNRTASVQPTLASVASRSAALPPSSPITSGQEVFFDEWHGDDAPGKPSMLAAPQSPAVAITAPWHRFPKGPQAGQFLHGLLESMAQEGFAHVGDEAQQRTLRQRCEREGMADWQDDTVHWLTQFVGTSLPPWQVCLSQVTAVVPEMEFWMPSPGLATRDIDALCRQHLFPGQARPWLPERQLEGMLMGFADLFVEHEGRHWVLDYKSNHLGPDDEAYRPEALQQAVCEKRYDAQGALYLLALHRLLRLRMGESYRPAEHLGGAIFVFLRGIGHPQAGCCVIDASTEWLDPLDALLQGSP